MAVMAAIAQKVIQAIAKSFLFKTKIEILYVRGMRVCSSHRNIKKIYHNTLPHKYTFANGVEGILVVLLAVLNILHSRYDVFVRVEMVSVWSFLNVWEKIEVYRSQIRWILKYLKTTLVGCSDHFSLHVS